MKWSCLHCLGLSLKRVALGREQQEVGMMGMRQEMGLMSTWSEAFSFYLVYRWYYSHQVSSCCQHPEVSPVKLTRLLWLCLGLK